MSGAPFSELHYKFCLLYAAAQFEREKAEAEAAKAAYRRNATDDDLVEEGVREILAKTLANPLKAAEAFCDQGRIPESGIGRIRKRIALELKARAR